MLLVKDTHLTEVLLEGAGTFDPARHDEETAVQDQLLARNWEELNLVNMTKLQERLLERALSSFGVRSPS